MYKTISFLFATLLLAAPGLAADKQVATFAGGCFWCVETAFEHLPGVSASISGYTGGPEKNPAYKDVARGKTGHTEAVQVHFDPAQISYNDLLQVFWRSHDPTDVNGQFVDRGSQYRPGIFFHDAKQKELAEASAKELAASKRFSKPIVTEITKLAKFYRAEEYHQDFYKKDPQRYTSYANGSGRKEFFKKYWGKDLAYEVASQKKQVKSTAPKAYDKPSAATIKKKLTSAEFDVTQKDGTERAFSGKYWDHKGVGIYVDIVSGEPLFSSTDKFKSGTGWPSFTRPINDHYIVEKKDSSLFMTRVEVRSKYGDSHLGHVFDDGPKPTGLRYCINSASLRFVPADKLKAEGYGDYQHLFKDAATTN